jgi:replication factor C subunit 3/5
MNDYTPWVEKYRPTKFEEIVLDPINKELLNNIIKEKYFPNLLFYGPPGTGKTTSIINLIKKYHGKEYTNSCIHLNASDERGIDIIRNQINSFVSSKNLFDNEMKFVILDEVDYMTKNAQMALRYLLQAYNSNVRFCLICNYISRIDEALQNEFVRLRFNQLPEKEIINFLDNINKSENLNFSKNNLGAIQKQFNSDIRSMINYMQSNQNNKLEIKLIENAKWDELTNIIKSDKLKKVHDEISLISYEFNIEKKNIIKNYLNYIIRNNSEMISEYFLNFCEHILHVQDLKIDYLIGLTVLNLKEFFSVGE